MSGFPGWLSIELLLLLIEMIFLQLTLFDVVSTAIVAADQHNPYIHTSHRVNFCTHNFKLSSLVFSFPENGGSLFLTDNK
jgi:hypothetical protein